MTNKDATVEDEEMNACAEFPWISNILFGAATMKSYPP